MSDESYEELYRRAWQQQIEASKKAIAPETEISEMKVRLIKAEAKEGKANEDHETDG